MKIINNNKKRFYLIDYVQLETYGRKISVLVVEDNTEIARELNFLLSDIFSKVEVTVDGVDALEKYNDYFNSNGKYYDLIISDIQMPNMNGIELIKNVYCINPKQKVIVLSAHSESNYLIELVNMGIFQFVLKPIDYNTFLTTIYKISKEIYETVYKNEPIIVSNIVKLAENLFWNKELKQLILNSEVCKLTKKELILLDLFLKIPDKTYTNEEIMDILWRDSADINPDISNLKNIISRFRKKIPELDIENVYGLGYRIVTVA